MSSPASLTVTLYLTLLGDFKMIPFVRSVISISWLVETAPVNVPPDSGK